MTGEAVFTKKKIRESILKQRSQLSEKDVRCSSIQICDRIKKLPIYNRMEDICLYMPIRNEVDVTYLIKPALSEGKKIWLPKVSGSEMEFYLYDTDSELKKGAYNILEPVSEIQLVPNERTLIVMPGAVFSIKGDRIGYGGGYYDRYLARNPKCCTMAVCYDFQVVDDIPSEPYDIRPQLILSESFDIKSIA